MIKISCQLWNTGTYWFHSFRWNQTRDKNGQRVAAHSTHIV